MPRIYLIRHGRPASTWGGADNDPGLDETGRGQAEAARDWLLALPPEHRPRRVASSPLRRCYETAQPMADALGVEIDVDPAVGEIPTPADLAAEDRPGWLQAAFRGKWSEIQGDLDYDVWRRAILASLTLRGDTAVFSHFVAINGVVTALTAMEEVMAFRPDHCSITVLETDGERVSLIERGPEASTSVL